MSDYVVSKKESFEYTYSAKEQEEVERIKAKYLPKQASKLEQLRKLDRQAERLGQIVSLVMGILGSLILGVGMCMCLLPEWNMFSTGVVVTAIGGIILLVTLITYRKMSGAAPIKVNWKIVGKVLYGVIAALVLGAGMAMIMAFEGMMIPGIIIGIVGIAMLLFLIPMCVGFKDSKKEETNN